MLETQRGLLSLINTVKPDLHDQTFHQISLTSQLSNLFDENFDRVNGKLDEKFDAKV